VLRKRLELKFDGAITYAAFVTLMQKINSWEESQRDVAVDTLHATGDTAPV